MKKLWSMIEKIIDLIGDGMGIIGWVLVFYCMIFMVIEVFLRYVLNSPTLWISTTVQAAMVLMACFAGAYSLRHNGFVKLDIIYARLSKKGRAISDILTASFSFLFLYALIVKGYEAAMFSIKLNQVTPTAIPIPIYMLKPFIPFAGVIVLLIVLKHFVNDLRTLFSSDPKR